MRLTETYRPRRLADIVGQPTHRLRWLVKSPSRSCWLLEGEPGTGKSATAHVLANELGSDMTTYTYTAGAMNKETIESLFTRWLRYVPPAPARTGWPRYGSGNARTWTCRKAGSCGAGTGTSKGSRCAWR